MTRKQAACVYILGFNIHTHTHTHTHTHKQTHTRVCVCVCVWSDRIHLAAFIYIYIYIYIYVCVCVCVYVCVCVCVCVRVTVSVRMYANGCVVLCMGMGLSKHTYPLISGVFFVVVICHSLYVCVYCMHIYTITTMTIKDTLFFPFLLVTFVINVVLPVWTVPEMSNDEMVLWCPRWGLVLCDWVPTPAATLLTSVPQEVLYLGWPRRPHPQPLPRPPLQISPNRQHGWWCPTWSGPLSSPRLSRVGYGHLVAWSHSLQGWHRRRYRDRRCQHYQRWPHYLLHSLHHRRRHRHHLLHLHLPRPRFHFRIRHLQTRY